MESQLVNGALNTTPSRGRKISDAWKKSKSESIVPYEREEALALVMETILSKADYQKIRNGARERKADIYPVNKEVARAKELCYPPRNTMTIAENVCKVELRALLDHTARRICQYSGEVVSALPENARTELTLISKWGCDGSSGQTMYKQKVAHSDLRDCNLFMSCMVPLELNAQDDDKKLIVWKNPRPSSTRYCRPIKLEFVSETPEVVTKERKDMMSQLNNLVPTECSIGALGERHNVTIRHQMHMTMIDGKVSNILTDTASSQTCNLCGATPVLMNRIDEVTLRPINLDALQYGLSTLYAYIRFLEWLLHVASRLEVKQWRVNKGEIAERKLAIQRQFREQTGLLVDVVKQGEGTTNDGNTARRFFAHSEESARITGVSEELIKRCDVILRTMASGYEVDADAFRTYTMDTAKLYVSKYPWFYMPASVHKVIIPTFRVLVERIR